MDINLPNIIIEAYSELIINSVKKNFYGLAADKSLETLAASTSLSTDSIPLADHENH